MKAIDNQIRNISSSHQDKHSDKVNSHQHHGKVDKTHRAKIVEFDKRFWPAYHLFPATWSLEGK